MGRCRYRILNARKEKHFSIFSVRFNEENILYNLNHYCEQNNFGTKVVNYWKDGRYIRIECVCQCGKIYNSNVGDFTTQNRVFCKECTKHQSRFERIVKAELQANDIKFEEQKRFDNCRSDIIQSKFISIHLFYTEKRAGLPALYVIPNLIRM